MCAKAPSHAAPGHPRAAPMFAGANPRLATPAWVKLQQQLLCWRLVSLSQACGVPDHALLTATVLLDMLKYRCLLLGFRVY